MNLGGRQRLAECRALAANTPTALGSASCLRHCRGLRQRLAGRRAPRLRLGRAAPHPAVAKRATASAAVVCEHRPLDLCGASIPLGVGPSGPFPPRGCKRRYQLGSVRGATRETATEEPRTKQIVQRLGRWLRRPLFAPEPLAAKRQRLFFRSSDKPWPRRCSNHR